MEDENFKDSVVKNVNQKFVRIALPPENENVNVIPDHLPKPASSQPSSEANENSHTIPKDSFTDSLKILREAFNTIDGAVVNAVLNAASGDVNQAFNALLGMTDPSTKTEDVQSISSKPSMVDAQVKMDEELARTLAYGSCRDDRSTYGNARERTVRDQNIRQPSSFSGQEGSNNSFYDSSVLEDEFKHLKNNIVQGYKETKSKFNKWVQSISQNTDKTYSSDNRYNDILSSPVRAHGYDNDPYEISHDFSQIYLSKNQKKYVSNQKNSELLKVDKNLTQESRPLSSPINASVFDNITSSDSDRHTTSSSKKLWEPIKLSVSNESTDPFAVGDSDPDDEDILGTTKSVQKSSFRPKDHTSSPTNDKTSL